MTISEKKVYIALKNFIEKNGYVPTIREFGEVLGFTSPATVHYYLNELEKKGCIKRINNRKIEFKEELWHQNIK